MKFETGRIYSMSSPGDHRCIWTFIVTKRTAKTVTLFNADKGTEKVYRPSTHDGYETVMPLGSYSMAPVLRA